MSCGIVSRSACLPCGESKACGETLLTVSPMSCATAWLEICPFSHHYEHPPMVYLFHLSLVCFKIYLSFRPNHLSVILLTQDFAVLSMPRTIMTRDNFCSSAAASFLNTECVSFCLLWYPQRLKIRSECAEPKRSILDTKFDLKRKIFLKSCWLQTCNNNLFTNTKRM